MRTRPAPHCFRLLYSFLPHFGIIMTKIKNEKGVSAYNDHVSLKSFPFSPVSKKDSNWTPDQDAEIQRMRSGQVVAWKFSAHRLAKTIKMRFFRIKRREVSVNGPRKRNLHSSRRTTKRKPKYGVHWRMKWGLKAIGAFWRPRRLNLEGRTSSEICMSCLGNRRNEREAAIQP